MPEAAPKPVTSADVQTAYTNALSTLDVGALSNNPAAQQFLAQLNTAGASTADAANNLALIQQAFQQLQALQAQSPAAAPVTSAEAGAPTASTSENGSHASGFRPNMAFLGAEDRLAELIGAKAVKDATDPAQTQNLEVQSVRINGTGTPSDGSFVSRFVADESYPHGDKAQRFDAVVTLAPDMRGLDTEEVRVQLLKAMQAAFEPIKMHTPGKEGQTLADQYDWSTKPPEDTKPFATQLADLQETVKAGIKEAEANGKPIPAQMKELLENPAIYNDKTGSVFSDSGSLRIFGGDGPRTDEKGVVTATLSINSQGEVEGGKSNSAAVVENIEARKSDIINSIVEKAVTLRQASGAGESEVQKLREDLSKLDIQVVASGSDYWKEVNVHIGSRQDGPADANGLTVDDSALKEFTSKDLAKIVNESILFTGSEAGKVSHLAASPHDIVRILEENKAAAPEAFGKALDMPLLKDAMNFQERKDQDEKASVSAKIAPRISPDQSVNPDGSYANKVHINFDLPKDVKLNDVVLSMAREKLAVGSGGHTGKVLESKGAVAASERAA